MTRERTSPVLERAAGSSSLRPYVPRLLVDWQRHHRGERYRIVEGTLVSADISGFTKLSERLAGLGRQGAEELTDLLNRCFDGMIAICDGCDGDVLKFGGDALLVLFTGPGHGEQACQAAIAMRASIEQPLSTGSGQSVKLGISIGVHSGAFTLYLVDVGHRELIVTGADATRTVVCEGEAKAGQILVTEQTAQLLHPSLLGPRHPEGRLLRRAPLLAALASEPGDDEGATAEQPPVAAEIVELIPAAQRDQIEAHAVGEHRQATVAFLKFSGTDRDGIELGPGAVALALQELSSIVQVAADRHLVHWMGTDIYPDGGKIILAAGVPSSTGDDEERMVRTMREVLDAPLPMPVRVGINSGPVFAGNLGSLSRRTFTVMGDAVNLAARLMQKADAGQIIASAAVLARTRSHLSLEPLEPFHVKGKSRPIEASVVGAVADAAVEEPDRVLPFVGRDEDVAALLADIAATGGGSGRLVELVGEPGIGKTRLVDEALRRSDGVPAVVAWCQAYLASTPYGSVRVPLRAMVGIDAETDSVRAGQVLADTVKRIAPELLPWLPLMAIPFSATVDATDAADSIDERFRRNRMHDAVADLVEARCTSPTVIRVEDTHWIDDASRGLIEAIASRRDRIPVVVCVTRTPDGASLSQPDRVVSLGPLDPEATATLAAAAIGDDEHLDRRAITAVVERSGGHPLFTIELAEAARVRGSVDGLPESVESALTSRIDTLPPTDRVLIRDAAVLGVRFDLALLRAALGADAAAPERWRRLGSVATIEHGAFVRFQHALLHRVAYEGLSYRRRRTVHQAVGEALEAGGAGVGDDPNAALSLHFAEAEDRPRAWRYSVLAGRHAHGSFANVEAAEFYGRALAAAAHLDVAGDEVADVAEALGDVCELAGRYDDAAGAYTHARKTATGPIKHARLMRKQGVVYERLGRYTRALRWYGRALHSLVTIDDVDTGREEAELALAYSGVRFRQGKYRDCIRWAQIGATGADTSGDLGVLAHAYFLIDHAGSFLGQRHDDSYAQRALTLFEELGDHVGQANVLNNWGVAAYYEGRWDDALAFYERSRLQREQAGDVIGAATALNNSAEILSDQGHPEEASAMFRDARRDFRANGYALGVAVATSNLGRAEGRSGRPAEGLALLEEAQLMFEEMNAAAFVAETGLRRSELLLLDRRFEQVVRESADLLDALDGTVGNDVTVVGVLRVRAGALAELGALDDAADALHAAIALAEKLDGGYELGLCLQARDRLEAQRGDREVVDIRETPELVLGVVGAH